MNKLFLFLFTGAFLILCPVTTLAQKGKIHFDLRANGPKDILQNDMDLLGYFPTRKDWKKISKQISAVPAEALRYVDSMDIRKRSDTLLVQIYSQNFAYTSGNIYKLTRAADRTSDTLKIYNVKFDMRMKSNIDNIETFRTGDLTVVPHIKQLPGKTKRIVFDKSFR